MDDKLFQELIKHHADNIRQHVRDNRIQCIYGVSITEEDLENPDVMLLCAISIAEKEAREINMPLFMK